MRLRRRRLAGPTALFRTAAPAKRADPSVGGTTTIAADPPRTVSEDRQVGGDDQTIVISSAGDGSKNPRAGGDGRSHPRGTAEASGDPRLGGTTHGTETAGTPADGRRAGAAQAEPGKNRPVRVFGIARLRAPGSAGGATAPLRQAPRAGSLSTRATPTSGTHSGTGPLRSARSGTTPPTSTSSASTSSTSRPPTASTACI